jgi:hypothetical protein
MQGLCLKVKALQSLGPSQLTIAFTNKLGTVLLLVVASWSNWFLHKR